MGLLAKKDFNSIDPFFGDSLLDSFFRDPWGIAGYSQSKSNMARYPIRRLRTEDGTYKVEFDVPGASKDDIEILYNEDNGVLTVSSKPEKTSKKKTESNMFSYRLSVYDLDTKTIEATCDKGILTITGKPITKQSSTKRIEIK